LAIGAKNEGSNHDYGVEIAQWVSALEILAWPGQKHADIEAVLRLLTKYPIDSQLQRRRYSSRVKGKTRRLSALQRAYTYMYRARNRFLHGNPVSTSDLLTLTRGHRVGLPQLAALVYRAALVAYLDQRYPKTITNFAQARTRADELFDDHSYEQGLARLFGLEK
jgi:hypothetical protein